MNNAKRLAVNTLNTTGESLDIHFLIRDPGMIFVTGGSGVVGHRVATGLLENHAQVRLGTGILGALDDMEGAEIVDFSWSREDTYAKALKGVKSVFITIPHEKNWHKHFPAFLQACKKARVKRFVKLSHYLAKFPCDAFHKVPLVKRHANCDELLKSMIMPNEEHLTQMSYTILYTSHYMSNPVVQYGKELNCFIASTPIYSASQYHGANYISPNDLAEASIRTLLAPNVHYNKAYTISGPEVITYLDLSILMSKYFTKMIPSAVLTMVDYKNILKESNTPQWLMNDLVAMQRIMSTGIEEKKEVWYSSDFEKICGHPPESFSDYLTRTDTMTEPETGFYFQHNSCSALSV